jgi:phosphoglycerate dehydrogenase-like enzyme
LGIVGYGRIGRRVGEICRLGLRMQVLAHDPFLGDVALPEGVQRVETLEELLARADFVTLHVLLTAGTRHLIGARELRQMKQGAYLINASRGPVVDEPALIAALEEGHLAGAGLDVFDPEPPLPASPLRRLPNVVITPHVAANTPQAHRRMSMSAVEQVLLVMRGDRPTSLLDPAVWPGRAAAWLGDAPAAG